MNALFVVERNQAEMDNKTNSHSTSCLRTKRGNVAAGKGGHSEEVGSNELYAGERPCLVLKANKFTGFRSKCWMSIVSTNTTKNTCCGPFDI